MDPSDAVQRFLAFYRQSRKDWRSATYVLSALLFVGAGALAVEMAGGRFTAVLIGSVAIIGLLVLSRIIAPQPRENVTALQRLLLVSIELTVVLAFMALVSGGIYLLYRPAEPMQSRKVVPPNPSLLILPPRVPPPDLPAEQAYSRGCSCTADQMRGPKPQYSIALYHEGFSFQCS
jgi:hypothetical protein